MELAVPPYNILRRIADGSSGTVYEAEHPGLQRHVALKVLHGHVRDNPEAVARFGNEARVLARIEHPNAVRVHDVNLEGDFAYIAMELVTGESLDQRITRAGPFPFDDVFEIAQQILSVLEVAHAQNIIHRDLKPANLMLDATHVKPFVRVVDFGIAQLLPPGGILRLSDDAQQLGTAAFMSPEQVSGEALDARSDLYSLACVLYELLTGRPPFFSTQTEHVLSAHLFREPPTLAESGVNNVPKAFESVLRRALSKPRDARFSSATEMKAALAATRTEAHARDVDFKTVAHEFIAVEVDAPAVKLMLDGIPPQLDTALREALMSVGAREAQEGETAGIAVVAAATNGLALERCAQAHREDPRRLILVCGGDDDLSFIADAIGRGAFDFIATPVDHVDLGKRAVRALRTFQDRAR